MMKRTLDLLILALLAGCACASLCWGPPGPPPEVPAVSPEALAATAALIVGYGIWKGKG